MNPSIILVKKLLRSAKLAIEPEPKETMAFIANVRDLHLSFGSLANQMVFIYFISCSPLSDLRHISIK
jgi:hypothetical protein